MELHCACYLALPYPPGFRGPVKIGHGGRDQLCAEIDVDALYVENVGAMKLLARYVGVSENRPRASNARALLKALAS